jgi:hypothetical protein
MMSEMPGSALHLVAGIGELVDTIKGIFHGFGELFQALLAILRLLGTLAGG